MVREGNRTDFLAPMKMTMIPEIIDMDMPVEGVFHNLVIAQIKKEYAGQGQKVMNAMWGAGQMMFNKILVIADEGVKIQNYLQLAQYVFKNLDPATDIYFSQGPMDVLDHSCSKMGFGGKMCIDGTMKFDEEKGDNWQFAIGNEQDLASLQNRFSEIHSINTSLIKNEIPVLIISVEKNRKGHIRELHQQICELNEIQGVKMILYVEHTVDANDLTVALWRFCNNLDPKRDSILIKSSSKASPKGGDLEGLPAWALMELLNQKSLIIFKETGRILLYQMMLLSNLWMKNGML